MSASEPLPVYSSTAPSHTHDPNAAPNSAPSAEQPPPSYTFPTRFAIGGTFTPGLLVNIPQIKGHLALLDAFARFKKEVEDLDVPVPDMPYDKEKRWAWVVGLAVERFDKWVRKLYTRDKDLPLKDTLPPVDVLMVWHAYMLNPRWYAEDGARLLVLKPLIEFGRVLAKELHTLPTLLTSPPTPRRITYFETWIGLRFSPIADAQQARQKELACPRCKTRWFVPYMTTPGTGYLQQSFSQPCARCSLPISRDALCALKLAEGLARVGSAPDTFLPGTFLTDSPAASQRESEQIRDAMRLKYTGKHVAEVKSRIDEYAANEWTPSPVDETMVQAILEDCKFSVAEVRGKLGRRKGLPRIMSANATHMVYSIDLVGAVLRQNSFITKMSQLHWTDAGYFDAEADEMALRHAIARYHAFLDLLSSSPASFFVPTLDIDLVWHTHQLTSGQYDVDCRTYVGRFVDHDDKVDGVKLSSSFDLTCRAWKDRFGLPYTYCGCPLPGTTIGERLSRFLSSSSSSTSSYSTPLSPSTSASATASTSPPGSGSGSTSASGSGFSFASASGSTQVHAPSQLVPPADRPDLLAATHASAHNLVQFKARNKTAWRVEQYRHASHKAKLEKRVKREKDKQRKKDQKEGKIQRQREREEEERRRERDGVYGGGYGCVYGQPFLMPVPMYYGAPIGGEAANAEAEGAVRAGVEVPDAEAGVRVVVMVVEVGVEMEGEEVVVDAEAAEGVEGEGEVGEGGVVEVK